LTNKEAEYVRCSISRYVGCSPDDIAIIITDENHILYDIKDFNGYNVIVGFDEMPTPHEIVEEIDEMYLVSISAEELLADEDII